MCLLELQSVVGYLHGSFPKNSRSIVFVVFFCKKKKKTAEVSLFFCILSLFKLGVV